MKRCVEARGLQNFVIIWFGQVVSLVGSGFTGFALSVWIYQQTGSATQLALVTLSYQIGTVTMSPLAGLLTDRWDRRVVMIISDSGAALSTLAIVLLLFANQLEIWHIYLIVIVSAAFRAFQWPAYSAAIASLVPDRHLGRANGMVQLGHAIAEILPPMLAGVLIEVIQLRGVILIDLATFLLALGTLLLVRIPRPERTTEGQAGKKTLLREATYGWVYIKARSGLLALLIFTSIIGFHFGIVMVLFMPLVLGFASPAMLGTVMSIGGVGMLAGGIVMSAWGGPKRRIYGVFASGLLMGTALLLGGLRPDLLFVTTAAFFALLSIPIIAGCEEAIWQSKVAPDVQGRVFAVRNVISTAFFPLASLAAGPMADYVFEPLLTIGGPLSNNVGRVIGVGQGRGIGLLFTLLGFLTILVTVGAYSYPRLRLLEGELADVTVDQDQASTSDETEKVAATL